MSGVHASVDTGNFSDRRSSRVSSGRDSPARFERGDAAMDEEKGLRNSGMGDKELSNFSPATNLDMAENGHAYEAETYYGEEKDYNGDVESNRGAQEFARQTKTNQEVRSHVQAVIEETEGLQKPTIVRNIAVAYIVSVVIVILLSVAGQVVVHVYIKNSFSDSAVVNIAGRQRMLSQLISKDALAIYILTETKVLGPNSTLAFDRNMTVYVNELESRLDQWRSSHYGLWYGNATLGLPKTDLRDIQTNFELLALNFEALYAAGQSILQLSPATIQPGPTAEDKIKQLQEQLQVILDNERIFLPIMNTITGQYEAVARDHLNFVLVVSWVLHSLVIVTLLLESMFLFRPALGKMQQLVGERYDLMRRTLEAEAESSGVSMLMMAYVSNELASPLHALEDHLEGAAEAIITHAERELKHDFLLDGIRADCQLAIENLQQGHMCVGLMQTVVQDVTSMRHLEVGRMSVAVDLVDVVGVGRQVVRLLAKKVRPGVTVEVEVDPVLQKEPTRQVDKHRLQQVIMNLVNNALRSTPAGTVVVRIKTIGATDRLRFEVQDGGRQLDPEEQANAFLPAMSTPGVSGREGHSVSGAGLSLYIVRMLVELQGGHVGIDGAPEGGNIFWFELSAPVEGAFSGQLNGMGTYDAAAADHQGPAYSGHLHSSTAALLDHNGPPSNDRKSGPHRLGWP